MPRREDRRAVPSSTGAASPLLTLTFRPENPVFHTTGSCRPSPTLLKPHPGARIPPQVYAAKDGYQNRFSRDGLGHHEPVGIFVLRELGLPWLVSPHNLHRFHLPLLRWKLPPSHSLTFLLKEREMAVVIVLPTREGSIHAEEDHPSPCVLNPAAAWVRNVPLPTLVAYRENVS